MDEYGLIQAEISRCETALEQLEENYQKEKRKIEVEYDKLENIRLELVQMYDEFADIPYHFSHLNNIDLE